MTSDLGTVIRQEIEHVFGRQIISSRDCIDLSADIFVKTQHQLNSNTLRRFFGLVKADYPPSKLTLRIFSRYCGFHSVEDIFNAKTKNADPELVEQESLLHYLISLFCETPVKDYCDKTFLSLVRHTIRFLNTNAALADKFQRLVAKTYNGQVFYFEHFVNIDKLNSYYEEGLRYYLIEKRNIEANIFANSIFVYKYWLNGNDQKLHSKGDKMSRQVFTASSNPHIVSRYYAALFFLLHAKGESSEEILIDLYKYYSLIIDKIGEDEIVYFEYVVSEALTLTGHYHDALYYVSQSEVRLSKSDQFKNSVSLQNLRLLKALAAYKTNDVEMAERLFDVIRPSEFYFLSKKFSGILYMYLANQFKRKNAKYQDSFFTLINETGFMKLKSLLA
jgi:hypothetical protein